MSTYWENKVLWAEGMFLRTQHFQQAERYLEKLARTTAQALQPLAWGFSALEIDQSLLKTGVFALTRAAGILPDGTPFDIPGDDDHPTPLAAPSDLRNAVLHLTLPVRRKGVAEARLEAGGDQAMRWIGQTVEVVDTIAGSGSPADLTVAKLDLRLMHERQELAGYVTLPVARLVEKGLDGTLSLDPAFSPTVLDIGASGVLRSALAEIRGLLQHRASAIAARLSSPGGKGSAEVTDFLVLMLANRHDMVLRHLSSLPSLHPERLYESFAALAGELSTITDTATNRPPKLPPYRHIDLQGSFDPLMAFLREALSAVFEQTAISIALEERAYNIRVARITDRSLFTDCVFVLAARSSVDPETLRVNLPKRTTIGPVERIRDLVNLQLGGAPLRPLPTEPRQIPFRAGMVYFEINVNSEDWKLVERSGGAALHVSGEVPDLALELWAIRGRVR